MSTKIPSVKVCDLDLQFGDIKVLQKLNLEIAQGEFLVLLGSSGCGKSTLLNCIAGLLDISAGQIFIGDKNVTWSEPSERGIGMVFQSYALYPQMTVEGNLSFGLKNARMPREEIKSRVERAAKILQIEPLLNRKPGALSGGQRQRVAIGRALVRDVDVFLFDEPLSNLDAKLRVDLRVELKLLHQRLKNTMIYVTHDQIEALTFADQVVVMHEGQIVQTGTPVELFEKPKHTFVGHFIGSPGMNILPCEIKNGQINFEGKIIPNNNSIKKINYNKTQLGIRPEFIKFSNDGIKVKIKRVSDTGRHKVIDTECSSGSIKILASVSTEIPSDSAHITFDQKYTYVYGDDWIIE